MSENLHRWSAGSEKHTNPAVDLGGSGCGSIKGMRIVDVHLHKDMKIRWVRIIQGQRPVIHIKTETADCFHIGCWNFARLFFFFPFLDITQIQTHACKASKRIHRNSSYRSLTHVLMTLMTFPYSKREQRPEAWKLQKGACKCEPCFVPLGTI